MKKKAFSLKAKACICILLLSFVLLPIASSMAQEGIAAGTEAGGYGGVVTEAEAAGAAAVVQGIPEKDADVKEFLALLAIMGAVIAVTLP